MSQVLLEVRGLRKSFGGLRAVSGVDLDVAAGGITGLIGPNGAGKSTLFNLIAGALRPDGGSIRLGGEEVAGEPPHRLFARGLVRTFQIPRPFHGLTLVENLMAVPGGDGAERLVSSWLHRRRIAAREAALRERALEVLRILALDRVAGQRAGELSGGQKKLLELGRVMMAEPRIVLLDEIGAGVNRTLLGELASHIERLNRDRGITFLVIEHDMDLIARLCEPVVVMAEGQVLTRGSMAELRRDPRVIEAYLGARAAHAA
ncbi:MAG: ABC transporter ATP-binding protein [Geminicoccaceae bacterium]